MKLQILYFMQDICVITMIKKLRNSLFQKMLQLSINSLLLDGKVLKK